MPKNRKNFFITLSIFTFIFVGLIVFAVPANSQTGTNLITSFTNGTGNPSYPYDAPNGNPTFSSNGNSITATETRRNFGGAASNLLTGLDTTKNYVFTYTYTRSNPNPGDYPNIRFVQTRNGRSAIYGYGTGLELNKSAVVGTNSITFKPYNSQGYIEISVGNGALANFAMTNISLTMVQPTVNISANPTTVTSGSASNITWTSTNATSCDVTRSGTAGVWKTGVSGTNVSSGALTANTTFTATCTGAGGTATASATVNVTAPPVSVSHSTTFNLTVTESAKPAPTNVVVTQEVCNGTGAFDASLKISWDKIPNATSYKLYRAPTTPAAENSPVTISQPTSGTKVEFLDKGLVSASSLGYGYWVLAVYGNPPLEQESERTDPVANPTKDCSLPSNESSVSLSCGGTSGCIANYNESVNLIPVGQGWNSCATASTPKHTGWNDSASWLVSSPAFNPTTDPVAYYKFDETSGTTASDSSGSNNSGTLTNSPSWTTLGKFSGALSFDGTDDYVDTKDFSFSKNDSFTFSVWAKTLAFGASQVIFGKPNPNWEYTFMTDGTNAVRFVYWNTTGSRGAIEMSSPSNLFPNNTWTHFVISYDGSTKVAKMYVNGIEKVSHSGVSDTFQNRTNNLWIGAGYYAWVQRYFNGSIDDVRIYNKALSATDVKKLYYSDFKASGELYNTCGPIVDNLCTTPLNKNEYTFTFSCEKDGGITGNDKADVCVKPPVVQIFSATAVSPTSITVEWDRPTVHSSFDLNYALIVNGDRDNPQLVNLSADCNPQKCSYTYSATSNTQYDFQLKTFADSSCGILESFSDIKSAITKDEVVSNFKLNATSPIKISAISSAGGSDLISTPSTITITPNDFTSDVALSLISVTKLNPDTNIWETVPINKFVPAFSLRSVGSSNYSNGSKFTITSKKGIGNRIPTGKYTLVIRGVGGEKDDTVDIVLNVGILSFDYREY